MKAFLLSVFSLLMICNLSVGQASFGIQAGANFANVKMEYEDVGITIEQENKTKVGLIIGAVAEIPLGSSLSFRPELNFIQKGYKFDENFSGINYTEKATMNYIEVPLNITYNLNAGTGRFFFGLGPTVGFGLSGKYEVTESGEPDEESDIKFDGDEDATDDDLHLKAIDFGGNILAGYKLPNGLFFTAGYGMGFSGLHPDSDVDFKNKGFSLKIGYMFGSGKGSK